MHATRWFFDKVNIVAGCKPWCREVFYSTIIDYPGAWLYVETPGALTMALEQNDPEHIFFLHWNWIVTATDKYECVCFHMGELPMERGGSPLQNLILMGKKRTKLNALRMTDEIDAGPVYLSVDLTLDGTAGEIYRRAMRKAARMIKRIVTERIEPQEQEGTPGWFRRRKPDDSMIPYCTLPELYNFIRMLDAEGYPKAFINGRGFRFEFTEAVTDGETVTAQVTIGRAK